MKITCFGRPLASSTQEIGHRALFQGWALQRHVVATKRPAALQDAVALIQQYVMSLIEPWGKLKDWGWHWSTSGSIILLWSNILMFDQLEFAKQKKIPGKQQFLFPVGLVGESSWTCERERWQVLRYAGKEKHLPASGCEVVFHERRKKYRDRSTMSKCDGSPKRSWWRNGRETSLFFLHRFYSLQCPQIERMLKTLTISGT